MILKTTKREWLSLFLVLIGFCAGVAFIWPFFTDELVTLFQLRSLFATSSFFLGVGCGVLTKNRFCYAVAAFGLIAAAVIGRQ